jgi:DNA-binding LytR/AlgR family response regulator
MRFRDSLYEKLKKNLQQLRKPDTNHRKQHTMQQQNYDELYTLTQNVTPINFSKEETQIPIPGRELSFIEGSQIIS